MAAQGEVRAHLEACSDCAHVDAVEQELTSALEQRLRVHNGGARVQRRDVASGLAKLAALAAQLQSIP
jgi:hypothetical protein